MSNQKAVKPLFLKTYGRQKRKLSAWISPDNRKRAFESAESSASDISIFEPAKRTKTRKKMTSGRTMRRAKTRAMACLADKDSDEENISTAPPDQPQCAQRSTAARKKMTSGRKMRRVKTKAMACLADKDSDEENISTAPPDQPQCAQRSTAASGNVLAVDRFVTRRRRPLATKATDDVCNSSDDFICSTAAAVGRRIIRPSRRKAPAALTFSSAENSVDGTGAVSFAKPFREIYLNESADRSPGLCSRKPLFCSTPSAGLCSKRPHLKHFPINQQTSTSQSISVSCIGPLSTFHEDLNSVGQTSTSHSPPPIVVNSGGKQSNLAELQKEPSTDHCEEPADHLFVKPRSVNKRSYCSERTKSPSETTETQNEYASLNLKQPSLVCTDTEGSSQFVSASGWLECLTDAQEEEDRLTRSCTVQLERVDKLLVSQLSRQTTYSSCLENSSSVHSQETNEHAQSVKGSQITDLLEFSEPSLRMHLSVTSNETNNPLQSTKSCGSTYNAPSSTDSQKKNLSPSAQLFSTSKSRDHSASVLIVEFTHHADSSTNFISGSQSVAVNSRLNDPGTEEVTVPMKDKFPVRSCAVNLKRLSSSQLKGSTQQKQLGAAGDDASVSTYAQKCRNDHVVNVDCPAGHTRSRRSEQRGMAPVRHSVDPGPEERTVALTETLKETCRTGKCIVLVKRPSPSQRKGSVQLQDTTFQKPTDVSASDDQPVKTPSKSVHAANADRHNEHTSPGETDIKRRRLMSFEENATDKDETVENSRDIQPRREKLALPPKEKKRRRSTSADRPATARKACVSGLSVSRWKDSKVNTSAFQSRAAQTRDAKVVDCSIDDPILTQHKRAKALCGTSVDFSTPAKANRLGLSCLLAELTPNTQTWSRLKAALSVHRKVFLTPKTLRLSVPGTPGEAEPADISRDLFATPLPKRLQSQLLSTASGVVFEDGDLSDAEKVYAECGQQGPLPWEECILPQRMKQCVKIGEGTFGEVFSTTNASGDTVALKVIPVEGSEQVNGEDQKTFGEILHEIIISKELSSLKEKRQNQTHGFIGLNDLHCVRGRYPPSFLKAWDAFDEKKGSENDRPDFFEKEQLFIVLEFEFGGVDLENSNGTLSSLSVAKSILHQVTAALAVAEQELQFEHRDLHWGNVLVKTTKQKKGSFLLNGTSHSVETRGVHVRIIDYSLSRLEIDGLTVSCDISKDEELFMGQGDYQFDIYRLMRQENGNDWSSYQPHSNVLWLHYLCSKLLAMKYRGMGGRAAKDMREELARFYDNILQYRSATEALQNCPMFQ